MNIVIAGKYRLKGSIVVANDPIWILTHADSESNKVRLEPVNKVGLPICWESTVEKFNEMFEYAEQGAEAPNVQSGMAETGFIKKMLDDVDNAMEQMECIQGNLREHLADAYIKVSGKRVHASDCSTSKPPAYTPGPCDCGALNNDIG